MADSKLKIDIRRSKILEKLKRDGKVYVTELSRELEVTPVTIRCDLDAMEKEGYLERISGGAIVKRAQRTAAEQTDPLGEIEHKEEKLALAQAVASMVNSGDTVFINSGSTAMLAAECLCIHSGLKVVTNSVAVATALANAPSFRVVMLGGELNARYGFTHGSDAQEKLRNYHADFAILSVDGISASGGVTTYHSEEAIIDRMMINGATRAIIAADSSKIGRAGFMRVYDPTAEIHLLTNSSADRGELERLREMGVTVTVV